MARIIPKSNIPNQRGVREFTKEEALARSQARREGKLVDAPGPPLAPVDAHRKRARVCITVPAETMRLARKLGKGNASRGVELALAFWDKRRKRNLT